jgi:hypothetical protein
MKCTLTPGNASYLLLPDCPSLRLCKTRAKWEEGIGLNSRTASTRACLGEIAGGIAKILVPFVALAGLEVI